MQIEILSKNYNVSEKLKTIITKKAEKLDRYFSDVARTQVYCKFENGLYKMEISIKDKNTFFRSEVASDNMYVNIDTALSKIERQVYKNKDKLKDKFKDTSFESSEFEFLADEPKVVESKVSRVKKFELDPTTVEDAISNLELTDHDFYVFLNAETGKVNVVYRRHDNNYGHIELDY